MVSRSIELNPHSLSGTWGPQPPQHVASLSSAMSDFIPVLFHAMKMFLPWICHALNSSVPSMMPFPPTLPAEILLTKNQLKYYWELSSRGLRLSYSLSCVPTEIYLYLSLGMFIILKSAIKASQWMTAIPSRLWTVYSLNFPQFNECLASIKPLTNLLHKKVKHVWGMMSDPVWLEQRACERKFRYIKLEKEWRLTNTKLRHLGCCSTNLSLLIAWSSIYSKWG